MSFPATYNFRYYVGDTADFELAPQSVNGTPMDLAGYTANFVISDVKEPDPEWSVDGFCEIRNNMTTIFCSISPDVGRQLTKSLYYYDVEIRKVDTRELVYTLLKGEITPEIGVNRHV